MSDLIFATREMIGRSEGVRLAALSAFAAVLAVLFLVLLIGDQVHAASF